MTHGILKYGIFFYRRAFIIILRREHYKPKDIGLNFVGMTEPQLKWGLRKRLALGRDLYRELTNNARLSHVYHTSIFLIIIIQEGRNKPTKTFTNRQAVWLVGLKTLYVIYIIKSEK